MGYTQEVRKVWHRNSDWLCPKSLGNEREGSEMQPSFQDTVTTAYISMKHNFSQMWAYFLPCTILKGWHPDPFWAPFPLSRDCRAMRKELQGSQHNALSTIFFNLAPPSVPPNKNCCKLYVNDEMLEQLDEFLQLGKILGKWINCAYGGRKVLGSIWPCCKECILSKEANNWLYGSIYFYPHCYMEERSWVCKRNTE